jgi:hypothetical protein
MKTILAFATLVIFAIGYAGCSAGASVKHHGHRHGVGVAGSKEGGVAVGARVY